MARNVNGPAQSDAELVLLKGAAVRIEEVPGIQFIVAKEFVDVAVQLVGA